MEDSDCTLGHAINRKAPQSYPGFFQLVPWGHVSNYRFL